MSPLRERRLADLRVLVVDDHRDTLDLLEQALTYAGATVMPAATARAALDHIAEADVVVTDYSMPGETGVWLLERVRERAQSVPVIALTGYVPAQVPALREAAFCRILLKPIDIRDLVNEIVRVYRRGSPN